jgi:hypothetical protein
MYEILYFSLWSFQFQKRMPPHEKAGIIIVCVANINDLSKFPIFDF